MSDTQLKLAIITSHPVQYNAPLFRLLAERDRIAIKVFYTWSQAQNVVYDPGFGKQREWDIPLLKGYDNCFVMNKAKQPGSHHFRGISNPTLIAEINSWNPDAILVFGWSFQSHLACLRYFKNRIPVLFRGDSTLLDETPSIKSLLRQLALRWVYRHVDLALYVGTNNKRYFQKFGLQKEQLVHAPHAVDNNRFTGISAGDKAEIQQWKKQLGFTDKDWIILFVGKLEEKKNPQFMLELEKRICEPNIKFLIVGNGKLETELKKQATGSGVMFLDFQNQSKMPLVYRLGNVLLLPSKGPGESWGLVANEAMNCGLPIILSGKVGSATDLVKKEETGLVFDPTDYDSVVRYIRRLFMDKAYYKKAKENARAHIRNFCFEKVAEAIEISTQKLVAN